ncbi:hypothetical protein [Nocardioides gansuensis]|uniref:hypothetical protein n=1 Tax=Nocardioides gansuensis TaxID=2138300 RepID=UPI001FE57237|nr:hypothetical protein [Nocardioides gansuensis]
MEILLWLVPSVLVTVAAMCWVSWVSRDGRGEVDRDEAVARLARAMSKDHRARLPERPVRPHDRSTGIAVRPRRDGAPRRVS